MGKAVPKRVNTRSLFLFALMTMTLISKYRVINQQNTVNYTLQKIDIALSSFNIV